MAGVPGAHFVWPTSLVRERSMEQLSTGREYDLASISTLLLAATHCCTATEGDST